MTVVVISRNVYVKYFVDSTLDTYNSSRAMALKIYPKILRTCKLFEVTGSLHDFIQEDLIAEAGPEDLDGEHLLEALNLKTDEKSVGTERVSARHS